jgi:hypothetical protein
VISGSGVCLESLSLFYRISKAGGEEHIFGYFFGIYQRGFRLRNILQCRASTMIGAFFAHRCILLLKSFVRLATQSALCSPPELISYCAYLIIIFIKHPECRDVTVFQFESLASRARAQVGEKHVIDRRGPVE